MWYAYGIGVVLTRQIWTINSFMQILLHHRQTVKHPKNMTILLMNPSKCVFGQISF